MSHINSFGTGIIIYVFGKLQFTILSFAPGQIWMTLWTHVPLRSCFSLHVDPTLLHVLVINNCKIYFSCYCHIYTNNKYASKMSREYYSKCISRESMPMYMSHMKSLAPTMWLEVLYKNENVNNTSWFLKLHLAY